MHLTLDQLNWGENKTGKSARGGTASNQCPERKTAPIIIMLLIIVITMWSTIIIIILDISFFIITLVGGGRRGGRREDEEAGRAQERLSETIAKE